MSAIYFTPRAMALMNAYVDLSEGEVSLLGKVERLGSDFLVTDVRLIEQESTWASTKLDEEALARFLMELVEKGEDPGAWKLWIHSHCGFEVFWSATDEATCRRFNNNEWMLSVVANRRREYLGRIDVYEPIHLSAELPVRVYTRLEDEEIASIKEELERKVRRKTWCFPDYRYRYGHWWADADKKDKKWEHEGQSTTREEDPRRWNF